MSRRDAWTSAWVFAAAAAVRLVYLSEYAHSPLFRQPIVDAATYDTMARALAAGHAGPELFWQAPLYPVFLSVVYAVFGHSFLAARLVQALLGSVTCVLVYLLARKIHGERAARIAAALACFCGPLILYETELVGAGLAAFWSVALTLLFLRAAEKPGAARVLTLGACGSLSVLTRPEFLLFFAAAAIWLIGRIRPIRQIGLVAAAFAVIALPFAAWNHSHTGSFSILPASGGINLYIGNNPDECRTLNIRPGTEWATLTLWPALEGVTGARAEDAFYREKVAAYARSEPLSFARGIGRKVLRYLSPRELPRNEDPYLFRRWSWLLSGLMWKAGSFGFPFGVLLPLALLGFVLRRREIPAPVWIACIALPAAAVLVFVSARYRVAVLPLLCVPAAAGALACLERKGWIAAAACCAALASLPGPFCEERVNYEAEMHQFLGSAAFRQDDPRRAMDELNTALSLNPDSADAHNAIAVVLATGGQKVEAAAHCITALKLRPEDPDAHFNYGALLFESNQVEPARKQFLRALDLRPLDANLHHRYGIVLASLGMNSDAIAEFRKAFALDPDLADLNFNLGFALFREGIADEAAPYLAREIVLEPDDAAAHVVLGDALQTLGDKNRAIEHYRIAAQLKPEWEEPTQRLNQLDAK